MPLNLLNNKLNTVKYIHCRYNGYLLIVAQVIAMLMTFILIQAYGSETVKCENF